MIKQGLLGMIAFAMSVGAVQAADPVKVGSKIDTEGSLLGNIILQVLNQHGVKTVNKIQLGTTQVVRGAITAGELDIYPEYTGNGAFFFNDEKDAAWKNAQQGYEKVKKLDAEKNHLVWLTPAPANNTWTIAVRGDVAQQNNLQSLDDLSAYLKKAVPLSWRHRRSSSSAAMRCQRLRKPTTSSWASHSCCRWLAGTPLLPSKRPPSKRPASMRRWLTVPTARSRRSACKP